jgi:hypothetical protein
VLSTKTENSDSTIAYPKALHLPGEEIIVRLYKDNHTSLKLKMEITLLSDFSRWVRISLLTN